MISGRFGDIGELFFEVDLIATDGDIFQVDALLDTGFTTGWLAMNIQDIDGLNWSIIDFERTMKTAKGEVTFVLYEGKVLLDGIEYTIPVHAGQEIPEPLLGLQWLRNMRLVVDAAEEILTLG
ncbi:MAG TPA: aspartyl protease [Cyanobacteria bacterium UBA11149]|nr:aspartyl protease [Cyanobacteria bacterium UBA11367]HBE59430.1 aspartyl protease [Cyanobacteria bacterium UBA11366]HBK65700.1 aspartyl protease [Cyanobacteria bacterium UBA11166]HBR75432.1 aspartyl protease [Cyanobacteria bacterium UBA11159]HBS68935.1 aspartyl protease [Cyanobacteria bacterium UBA11153]HBW90677.1 aspartyl protease [Cyanobacteria bacterium UBA11149]HCA97182.1 aspartyl protease [Cyanobacteria bacterium UBA9226]